jgi:acetyltransferase-like isoleucine patch superfamily enzyme
MTDELAQAIRALQTALSAEMRATWDRDLPLGELLADRWERARSLGFGEGSSIYAESYVYGQVRVGTGVWIGPYTILDGSGGLSIGDGSTISAGVHIYSHDTVLRTLNGDKQPIERKPVEIGAHVYIGSQAVIVSGVTIGDMCVIGTGSLVNRDIEPNTIVAGVPARSIGRVLIDSNGMASLDYRP